MNLEARSANCFSSKFVLKVNGRPVGKYEGRWFSESLDVYLTERRRLEFRKVGWLGSQFVLVDPDAEQPLGECCRSGLFSSGWDMTLSNGAGRLVKVGWFASAYVLEQRGEQAARVDRLGCCERGWLVEGAGGLFEEDLLLIGMVFHTVLQRQAQQHHGGHAAGS